VLSISNAVGKESHSQYLRNRELAWLKLAETVQKIILTPEIKEQL